MIKFLLGFNAVLAFVLELIMFYSFGGFGYSIGKTSPTKWVFAIVLVSTSIVLWGIWAAPKSEYRLSSTSRYIFELSMFLLGAYSLYKLNNTNWALTFAIIAIINVAIAFIFKQ
jgi:hypothetical protein